MSEIDKDGMVNISEVVRMAQRFCDKVVANQVQCNRCRSLATQFYWSHTTSGLSVEGLCRKHRLLARITG